MGIKLIAIDVDNTLLNSKHKLTPKTKATLKAAIQRGVKVVIASGRPLAGTQWLYQKIGIGRQPDQYAINFNGGLISTTQGKILAQNALSGLEAQRFYQLALKLGVKLQLEAISGLYTPFKTPSKDMVDNARVLHMPLKYIDIKTLGEDDRIGKLTLVGKKEKMAYAYRHLPEKILQNYSIGSSSPIFLEFSHQGISKGFALRQLAGKLAFSLKKTMAIGDENNDLSMIKVAGVGVAMGNGISEIKRQADFVTRDNDSDGVAVAIEKYIS